MVIVDTSVLIDHLRQAKHVKSLFRKFIEKFPKESITVSMVTISELYAGKSTRSEQQEKDLLATIAPMRIVAFDYEVAIRTGKLMRDVGGFVFTDAAIAATALVHQASLLTLNTKDFSSVPGLVLAE